MIPKFLLGRWILSVGLTEDKLLVMMTVLTTLLEECMQRRRLIKLGAGSILGLSVARLSWAEVSAAANLRIIATTDVHSFLTDFDYYRNETTDKFGFTRAATLIAKAREEAVNSVLVDNGDLIQGNPIADYQAAVGHEKGEPHPAVMALNAMHYDVGGLGNHEFNYGLDYLDTAIAQAKFPIINTNVMRADTGEPRYQPFWIEKKMLLDEKGAQQEIQIGYLSFVPPQIMLWDKAHLDGKVVVQDIVQSAKSYAPKLKEMGADVVIALAHTGPSSEPYEVGAENCAFYLADVAEIDAVIFGHAHRLFPHEEFAEVEGVDIKKGTVYGMAESMAGYWANHVSVVDLSLAKHEGQWVMMDARAQLYPIYDAQNKVALTQNHAEMTALLAPVHEKTLAYVSQPIGRASADLFSYLALVQADPTVGIVNQAQTDYAQKVMAQLPELAGLPVLSAAAPFKAGGRKNDPEGYTQVEKGALTLRNAADLYLYPNTLAVVKITGAQLKEWLECSAGMFNQIDKERTQPQTLINWEGFRTYNFDTISGVRYQIDVTQPARYDGDCQLINADAERIVGLSYQGRAVLPEEEFLVATNNYRANGGKFAGTGSEQIVFSAPDENRQILANYISEQTRLQGEVNTALENNWQIAPIQTQVPLDVRFETGASAQAEAFIQDNAHYPLERVGQDELGFAIYRIDLRASR